MADATDAGAAAEDAAARAFLAFKKNAPQLYATLFAFELPWPSATVQWLPELVSEAVDGKSRGTRQRLLLATCTGGQAPEYVRIAEMATPEVLPYMLGDPDEKLEVGSYNAQLAADLRVVQRITVSGTVLRARAMPQNCSVVASVASNGLAAVFDVTKFPYQPVAHYLPTIALTGHEDSEGVCLGWSPVQEGALATGDAAGRILLWDLRQHYDHTSGRMQPRAQLQLEPAAEVNDVQFHPRRPAVLATAADDGTIYVHFVQGVHAELILKHKFAANPTALAWNPVNDSLLAVGLASGDIVLMDLRTTAVELFTIAGAHAGVVTALCWNTWHPAVLASASVDTTVKVWNAAAFAQEPLFVHSGHGAPVTDVHWNPAKESMLASVAEDNGLHIYEPSDDLLGF